MISKTDTKEKNKKILIALGLFAGVILIILSFFTAGNNGKTNNKNTEATNNLARINTETYINNQEKKLCELLNRINGVSESFVMITLDSSSEYIYASKQSIKESSSKNGDTTQKDVQKDIVFYEDEKKTKSPILVKEIQPKMTKKKRNRRY